MGREDRPEVTIRPFAEVVGVAKGDMVGAVGASDARPIDVHVPVEGRPQDGRPKRGRGRPRPHVQERLADAVAVVPRELGHLARSDDDVPHVGRGREAEGGFDPSHLPGTLAPGDAS